MKVSKQIENACIYEINDLQHIDQLETISSRNTERRRTETLLFPCFGTRNSVENGDSLESFIDDYLKRDKQTDNRHGSGKKCIDRGMIEDTFLDCLSLSRNPKSLKRFSHTILKYFAYIVFNQIKNNYYKNLSEKRNCQGSTVLFFERKSECLYLLYNDSLKKTRDEKSDFNGRKNVMVPKKGTKSEDDLFGSESKGKTSSNSSHEALSARVIQNDEDAFLCNIPNAPPFILKMNRASSETSSLPVHPEDIEADRSNSSLKWNSEDELFDEEVMKCQSHLEEEVTSRNLNYVEEEKLEGLIDEMPKLNMYIDESCPCVGNAEFKKFISKSVTWVKANKENRWLKNNGAFKMKPAICMTGLTGSPESPFGSNEIDSRRSVRSSEPFPNSVASSSYNQSKIPRMLHPGRCKVRAKMKNVQLPPSSNGCSANSPKKCSTLCQVNRAEIPIRPHLKISVSTTCPSFTNTSASAGDKSGCKLKNANIEASKPLMSDCVKGIKSEPGCYCEGKEPEDVSPCPVRLREDFGCEKVEMEIQFVDEPEETDELIEGAPSDQPFLMKKSQSDCDGSNKKRCQNEPFEEPPEEKPDVFWALTKVTLLKDGSKNFEIIDVSPVPPGYYLMPDVNNLVLVGPQPKPAKATPSKNCRCE